MVMSSATSRPRAEHRPTSLPLLHPPSPFVLSFGNLAELNERRISGSQLASPITASPSPTFDGHSPPVVSHAVKASRSTADLIRLLDLEARLDAVADLDKVDRIGERAADTMPPVTSSSPTTSPLSRANMSKLREATRTSKRSGDTQEGTTLHTPPAPAARLASPIRFAPSPKSTASKRTTVVTESSYGPIQSVAGTDLHLCSDPGNAETAWPGHEGVGLPDSMSQLSLYAAQPSRLPQQDDSFMRFDGKNGSDTFDFPAPPTTDIESDYAPSMAAPSSVFRRVAKWTSKQEAVMEEEELEPTSPAPARKSPPAPLASSDTFARLPQEDFEVTPTTSYFTSNGSRVSEVSGNTFGRPAPRRAISAVFDPVVEETFADLDRIRAELLPGDTVKHAPNHLANARMSASDFSIESRGIESDEAITAHLLRAAKDNTRRIVPTDPHKPIGPSGKGGFAPTNDPAYQLDADSYSPASPRLINKIDQILGRGAYEAGMSMEQERRILREALAKSVVGLGVLPSLPPPPRQHKASAWTPLHSTSSSMESPLSPQRDERDIRSYIPRVGSIDSISDSLADSVTRLLPSPTVPRSDDMWTTAEYKPLVELANVTSKNELSPEQRQILLRRVRVLEKRLGEPLREDETGKWVVQPSTGVEYAGDASSAGHARSQSNMQRIKAAFGLDRVEVLEVQKIEPFGKSSLDEALARTLSAESMGTVNEEDLTRAQRRRQLAKLNKLLGTIVHPSHLNQGYIPASPTQLRLPATSGHESEDRSDEVSFMDMDSPRLAVRRLSDSSGARETWATKIRQTIGRRTNSNREIPTIGQDQSFFDMRTDGGGWRKHKPSTSSPAAASFGPDARDFLDTPDEMSAAEKSQARKKAKKLSQKFGEAPPLDLYHPQLMRSRSSTPVPDPTGGPVSMMNISQSLQSLVYLAENDPSKLDQIVDVLAEESPSSSPLASPGLLPSPPVSPPRPYRASTASSFEVYSKNSSPATPPRVSHPIDHTLFSPSLDNVPSPDPDQLCFDPSSHDARRRRSGKLSNFFGEMIDFERPPPLPPKKKTKKEVLDGVLGEMWRAVQVENRRGVLAGEEVEKVGAMIAAVRKSQQ